MSKKRKGKANNYRMQQKHKNYQLIQAPNENSRIVYTNNTVKVKTSSPHSNFQI